MRSSARRTVPWTGPGPSTARPTRSSTGTTRWWRRSTSSRTSSAVSNARCARSDERDAPFLGAGAPPYDRPRYGDRRGGTTEVNREWGPPLTRPRRDELLPALHDAHDAAGWLAPEVLDAIADRLGLGRAEVHGVASFYGAFSLTPRPRRLRRVCTDIVCAAAGAADPGDADPGAE
ncbi:MAG: hypothetical protein FJW95_17375, partial [Actinobacteria bacterium]|nr:hypothetical protein [Actinomycetota bacterium]